MRTHITSTSTSKLLAFAWLILTPVFATSCVYDQAFQDVSCDSDSDCPQDSMCEAGYCTLAQGEDTFVEDTTDTSEVDASAEVTAASRSLKSASVLNSAAGSRSMISCIAGGLDDDGRLGNGSSGDKSSPALLATP